MRLENGQTLLFIGDSITDAGRAYPVGEGEGLGEGYVSMVDALLATGFPEIKLRILNTGISGNRIVDLEQRWEDDVLAHDADWLSVMIGINDVWRQFDSPRQKNQVSLELYESVYRGLLQKTRPLLDGLVLMTPYMIEPDRGDAMRQMMDAYGQVVKRLSVDFDAIFVDVQAGYDRYLEHRGARTLCDDRVHPNGTGHMIIARAFLEAVGFGW